MHIFGFKCPSCSSPLEDTDRHCPKCKKPHEGIERILVEAHQTARMRILTTTQKDGPRSFSNGADLLDSASETLHTLMRTGIPLREKMIRDLFQIQ